MYRSSKAKGDSMSRSQKFNKDDFKADKDVSTRSMGDWLKKAVQAGSAAEPLLSLLGQADKTRKDITQLMARELKAFLDTIQVQDILRKVLSNATLEVEAKIRLIPDENVDPANKIQTKKTTKKVRVRKTKSS